MSNGKIGRSKPIILMAMLMIVILAVSGCSGNDKNEPQSENPQEQTALSGAITVAGSTSVQPFSEVLAEEFMAQNSGVRINVQGGGSSQGIAAAVTGAAQIGSASRDIKEEELSQGLVPIQIAIDGIAVVVNPDNTVPGLTSEEVKDIFLGNIKNWQEVGGEDAPITVVTREEASGTRDAFITVIMEGDEIMRAAIVQNSTGAVRTTVAGDKNAIGYISLAKVNEEVTALRIDGVVADEANVKNGSYTLQRPFYYVTKGQTDSLTQAFIDFVLGDGGQSIIEQEGAYRIDK